MVDFELSAAIRLVADKAIQTVNKLQTGMMDLAKEIGLTTEKGKLDVKKLASTIALLGAVSGGAFAAIINASPSMSIAFFEMRMAVQMMWMEIGENLAPIIQDTLVPAVKSVTNFIQNLNPQVQQWIGLTIGVTVAVTGLVAIMLVLNTVSLPLIGIIVGISAVVAGIIVLFTQWEKISVAVKIGIVALSLIVGAFVSPIALIVGAIVAVIAVFKNWGTIVEWFKGIWDSLIGSLDAVGKVFGILIDSITGLFKGVFNFFANAINAIIVDPINNIINFIDDKIWKPRQDNFGELQGIPTYHAGGLFIPPTGQEEGLTMLKRKERVRTETQERALQQRLRQQGGMTMGGGNNVTIHVGSVDSRQRVREIAREVEKIMARNSRKRGIQ